MGSPYNPALSAAKAKKEAKARKNFKLHFDAIKKRGKDNIVGTPQRIMQAPIERLKKTLTIHEFTAADELIAAYKRSQGAQVSRDVDFDVLATPVRFDAADDYAARQSDLSRAYQDWRKSLEGSRVLTVAKDVLFAELTLRQVDARYKWRKGLARGYLGLALRHFASIRGNVPRGAHDWELKPQPQEQAA